MAEDEPIVAAPLSAPLFEIDFVHTFGVYRQVTFLMFHLNLPTFRDQPLSAARDIVVVLLSVYFVCVVGIKELQLVHGVVTVLYITWCVVKWMKILLLRRRIWKAAWKVDKTLEHHSFHCVFYEDLLEVSGPDIFSRHRYADLYRVLEGDELFCILAGLSDVVVAIPKAACSEMAMASIRALPIEHKTYVPFGRAVLSRLRGRP